jgi:hypothetical protein
MSCESSSRVLVWCDQAVLELCKPVDELPGWPPARLQDLRDNVWEGDDEL